MSLRDRIADADRAALVAALDKFVATVPAELQRGRAHAGIMLLADAIAKQTGVPRREGLIALINAAQVSLEASK